MTKNKIPFIIKFRRFFERKCDFCDQVACRKSYWPDTYHCLNEKCLLKSSAKTYGGSNPLNSTGWKYNNESKKTFKNE